MNRNVNKNFSVFNFNDLHLHVILVDYEKIEVKKKGNRKRVTEMGIRDGRMKGIFL